MCVNVPEVAMRHYFATKQAVKKLVLLLTKT
jgi:hypothetical protein